LRRERSSEIPNVTVEVGKQNTPQEEEQIIAAVHAALMEEIKTRRPSGTEQQRAAPYICAGPCAARQAVKK